MAKKEKQKGYPWKFSTVGGVTRVNIETGEDVAHLNELDQKLWTVLSCPVNGLEFDAKTLKLMDADGDGKIRVNEVVAAAEWLKKVLKDMEYLLEGNDHIAFADVQCDTEEGKVVMDATNLILSKLGVEKDGISLADVDEYMTIYEEKCRAEYVANEEEPFTPPYGEASDDAEAAVIDVKSKIDDYFMRCKLAQFDEEATPVLDVQVEKIAAISDGDLSKNTEEIASYPIARPSKEGLLPLTVGVNPAWQAAVAKLKALVVTPDFGEEKTTLTEEEWKGIEAKIDAYVTWKAAGETKMNETIAEQLATHAAAIAPVERLVRYCRDFFKLLHNYVVFRDFYKRDENCLAVFQAGKLYIDQRCCDLCIKVSDMGKQTAMAGFSGLYLLYCTCTSKVKGEKMDIVAALTDGDVDSLREGQNAIFYDRNGLDWDATVTKIIDNPISIRQAFWSPYRKFGNWVSEKITKTASEKESAQFDKMTSQANDTTADLATKMAKVKDAQDNPGAKKTPFDIAKFAGIFAAIGMAIGFISSALVSVAKGATANWYNAPLMIIAIILVISGPSMLLAWLKLRKRNLGPVLNANGWAINSKIRINTTFGATLTSLAKYPKIVAKDPFADKKTPWWKKTLYWLLFIVVVAFIVLYAMKYLPWQAPKMKVTSMPVSTATAKDGSLKVKISKGTPDYQYRIGRTAEWQDVTLDSTKTFFVVEGLTMGEDTLWVKDSHGLKRSKPFKVSDKEVIEEPEEEPVTDSVTAPEAEVPAAE
ncbi:MAG: hypothetical protein IJL38_08755 [Bacteroidales bacterium]|nr:hypothetical protein [Bacteroidales bacterium]